ncbi:unnamed protein product [Rotaria socialis]|uniref:Uncharacterized protein n=3 Tax=Rotaria socialis TaxID=392032 RepID=A0A817QGU2_9BILA|nr:unnamed protein product [Rotaria socialis]
MSNTDEANYKITLAFDELLTTLGSDEPLDCKKVKEQFTSLLGEIVDLEESNKPLFYNYRLRYHTLRVSYFQIINNKDEALKEEKLLHKYERLSEQFPSSEVSDVCDTTRQPFNNKSGNTNYIEMPSWSDVQSQITSLSDVVDVDEITNAVARIRVSLESLFQYEVRTLEELQICQNNCRSILSALNALKIGELHDTIDDNDNEVDDESSSNYLNCIMELIDFVTSNLENRQVVFASVLLSNISQLNELVFHDIPQTEQCIRRRYYEWARMFHSDRHNCNPIFDELMKHINTIRDQHLSKIDAHLVSEEIVQYELNMGHRHYEFSQELKRRSECSNDPEFSVAQLRRLVSTEALWAFEHYRAALKSLGKMKEQSAERDLLQRVEILTFMGLMMRQTGGYEIEAQLYIVAGIYIITLSTMTPRLQQKLRDLQEALKKYQQISTSTTITAQEPLSNNSTSRVVALCTDTRATPRQIHDETQVFVRETILRQCIVRSGQPADLTIDINQRTLEGETFTTSNSTFNMIAPILSGRVATFAGSWIVYSASRLLNKLIFVKKRRKPTTKDLTPEYHIRQSLNEMMREAVGYYNNGQYARFIGCLAESYYHSRRLMVVTRGSETISIEIRIDQLITPLLDHGFRADKVAHILILIGEVFLRGLDFADPTLKNPEYTALLEQSKILFQAVYDSKALRDAALELDRRVECYHRAIISKYAPKLLHGISAKDITDSQSSLFISRLDGYCRLARLNCAIACLLAAGKENFDRCKQALTSLKQMTNRTHDEFFAISQERIYALEDLLTAFGMDDDDSENISSRSRAMNMKINLDQIEYMKMGHSIYHACKLVLPVTDEDDQLTLLNCLLLSEHHFDCEEFIQFVLAKNPKNDERINTLLRKDRVSTLSEWAENFRRNKKIFKHCAYLPLLSEFGNMHIQPCDVNIDQQYRPVFVAIPSQTTVDYTQGKSEPKYLYVVVRSGENHISGVFTIVPKTINGLHSTLETMDPKDPRRVKLLLPIATHYEKEAERLEKRNHLLGM